METEQLRLFYEPKTKIELVQDDVASVASSVDNLRKGLFKRHSLLASEIKTLQCQVDYLQMQLFVLESYIKKYINKEMGK